MKSRDMTNLLHRAAAAIETPGDITEQDSRALVEDLVSAAGGGGGEPAGAGAAPGGQAAKLARAAAESLPVPSPRPPWEDDGIQFPRFIAEADAAGAFTPRVVAAMADSMDLGAGDVLDLLARATLAWERIKDRVAGRGRGGRARGAG